MRARVLILVLVAAGCAAEPRVLLPEPPRHTTVGSLRAAHPLAAGQNILPVEVARGEQGSMSLIQIRDREPPHVHTRYDLTVVLVGGHGVLWLAGEPLVMRTGDVAFVPRGTPHFFVNQGDDPAAALVSFAPAFSGPDSEPVAP